LGDYVLRKGRDAAATDIKKHACGGPLTRSNGGGL
jgi:hypothetical protein